MATATDAVKVAGRSGQGDNEESVLLCDPGFVQTVIIVARVLAQGLVTRSWCVTEFGVANDTAGRDLKGLTALGLLAPVGRGRAAHYVVKATGPRPTES